MRESANMTSKPLIPFARAPIRCLRVELFAAQLGVSRPRSWLTHEEV